MRGRLALLLFIALVGSSVVARTAWQDGPPPPPPPPPPPAGLTSAPLRDNVTSTTRGSAFLGGIVVSDEATPRPLRRATVTLRDLDRGEARLGITDDSGRFVFRTLPAGRFTLTAVKGAYVTVNYGARTSRGPGLPIALGEAQRLDTLRLTMARGAVLAGRVIDDRGQPVSNARVTAVIRDAATGRLTSQAGGAGTDDRGAFRIYGLPGGMYILSASNALGPMVATSRTPTDAELRWASGVGVAPGASSAAPPKPNPTKFAPVYFPDAMDPALASPITVAAGEERQGLDLVMRRVATSTVTGTVVRTDGLPARGVQVIPVSTAIATNLGLPEFPPRAAVSPDGTFTVGGLSPGHYMVTARAPSSDGAPATFGGRGGPQAGPIMDLWARMDIDVRGEDLSGIALTLAPGMTVTGRAVFEGATAAPTGASTVSVALASPPGSGPSLGVPSAQSLADGTFSFSGVPPGAYLLNASIRSGPPSARPTWMLKSATASGRDVLDTPLAVLSGIDVSDIVVTFTDRVTTLTGVIKDQSGRPVPTYSVIVFSTRSDVWRQGSRWVRAPQRPASDGRYTLAGLPPGEYYVALLADATPNDWYSAAFLETVVPGALRVTLTEGETTTQDLALAVQ